MTNRLFLLDAYALIYRAYYAFIKNPRINSKGLNTSAIFGFVNTIEDLIKREQPTHLAVVFDPPTPTFRHEIYTPYKAQREETPEAIRQSVPIIKEIIKGYNIPIIEVNGFEADDVIGTVAKMFGGDDMDVYMMTPDKDFGQLVTENIFVYRPKFGSSGFDTLGIKEFNEKFDISNPLQVIDILGLMGDTADNIPGCPGVGAKTAAKLIKEFGSIENLVDNTESLKGVLKGRVIDNREQILLSKFLATIKIDVPVTVTKEELQRKEPNCEKLEEIFEELEFRNMINRIKQSSSSINANQISEPQQPKIAQKQPSLFDIFEDNDTDNSKYENVESLKPAQTEYYLTDTEVKMDSLALKLEGAKYFAFDTETTDLEPMRAELVGISFSMQEGEAFYVPIPQNREDAEKIVAKFKTALQNPAIQKIGQNIKYDYIMLKKYGVDVDTNMFDTMIAHYLLQPEQRHNMDFLAKIYLNHDTIKIEELIGKGKSAITMRQVDVDKVCQYACEDADVTLKLHNIFKEKLRESELEELFYKIEMPLVVVLADMEINGVELDQITLSDISKRLTERLTSLTQSIYQLADCEFNINSSRQVGEILFDKLKIDAKAKKTKQGQYSTTEEILTKLASRHPIVEEILHYRGVKKLLSTYVDSLPQLVNPVTGRIHTSFNQAVAATGRLSCSNPNLQNIPIRTEEGREIRRAFVPNNNQIFFSADYSQVELRIMAHLSGDTEMIAAFNGGEDIHTATAAKIYKIPNSEVTTDMRRMAKTANFGIIYGISAFGLAERLNISRSEAKGLIDGYFETFPKVKEYMDKSIAIAREKGYVETIVGRKRMLPDIASQNSIVRGFAERNAINAPIQGSAADIIKIAMINIHNRFKREDIKATMIIQVHDELNFSVPQCEIDTVKNIVTTEMANAYKMSVPLIADSGCGINWLEAH